MSNAVEPLCRYPLDTTTGTRGAHAKWAPDDLSMVRLFGPDGLRRGARGFVLTKGRVSVGQVIGEIADAVAPADVSIMSWSINARDAELFRVRVADGRISRLRVVLDKFSDVRSDSRRLRCSWLTEVFGSEAFRVTANHAKCAAIVGGGYKLAVRSSGNLNANPRCEQIDVGDEPYICDAISGLVTQVFATNPPGFHFGSEGSVAFDALMTGHELEDRIDAMNKSKHVESDDIDVWSDSGLGDLARLVDG